MGRGHSYTEKIVLVSGVGGIAIATLSIIFAVILNLRPFIFNLHYLFWNGIGIFALFPLVLALKNAKLFNLEKASRVAAFKNGIAIALGIGLIGFLIQYFIIVEIISYFQHSYQFWLKTSIFIGGMVAFAISIVVLGLLYTFATLWGENS
jgi:hypothetical protein